MAKFGQGRTARENDGWLSDDALWFDGAIDAAKGRRVYGTAGDDDLTGTKGNDRFHIEQGGDDTLHGGKGDDFFFFGNSFTNSDFVDGGDGADRVIIKGTLESQLIFGPDNLLDVDRVKLFAPDNGQEFNYNVRVIDGLGNINIDAQHLHYSLKINAGLLSTGNVRLSGGTASDVLVGGSGNDVLYGGFFLTD